MTSVDMTPLRLQDGERYVTIFIHADGTDPMFPALLDEVRWNGWEVPYFRPEVLPQIEAWCAQLTTVMELVDTIHRDAEGNWVMNYGQWEGTDVISTRPDGRYCVGGWLWTWQEVVETV